MSVHEDRLARHQQAALQEFLTAAAPIDADLQANGVTPSCLADYEEQIAGRDAIEVFRRHIDGSYPDTVKTVMAMAMTSIHSEYVFDENVGRLRSEVAKGGSASRLYIDSLAAALAASVLKPATLQKLGELAFDKSLGPVRVIFLRKFKAIKDPATVELLIELSKDPELRREILSWKPYWRKHCPSLLT